MGFLCKINNDKKIVSLDEISNTTFLRDAGLNNVNNVNSDIIVCTELFNSPQYYVSGATSLVSGMTTLLTGCTTGSTAIYNLDYTPDINISFVITGGTDYTGYTGSFCYKIFSDDRFFGENATAYLTSSSETIGKCISFSAITSTTITEQIVEGQLESTWKQYMIRPYYTFQSKTCDAGLEINTWDNQIQPNNFNADTDFYFVTIVDPPIPQIAPPPGKPSGSFRMYQQILLKNGITGQRTSQAINDELNYFIFDFVPLYDEMVFVNGVLLTKGDHYSIIERGGGVPPVIEFSDVQIKITDWIVVLYMVGPSSPFVNQDFSGWYVETFRVSSILIDTDPGYANAVNSNTITGNYEIYTQNPIQTDNAIFLTINGVEMPYDEFFFLSQTKDNRLIVDKTYAGPTPIYPGDIISILYPRTNYNTGNGDYGSLTTNEFTVQWLIDEALPSTVTGEFIVEVFNSNAPTVVMYSDTVEYDPNVNNYTSTISNLSLGIYYNFKITFKATYTAYLDNEITTCSYVEGTFDTDNKYILNSY